MIAEGRPPAPQYGGDIDRGDWGALAVVLWIVFIVAIC